MRTLYFKACKDKEVRNYSYYHTTPIAMVLDFDLDNLVYTLKAINIQTADGIYVAKTVSEAMNYITTYAEKWTNKEFNDETKILRDKNIKRKAKGKERIKDDANINITFTFLVYTDTLKLVKQYFNQYIVANFNEKSLQTDKIRLKWNNYIIEFRESKPFMDSIKDMRTSLNMSEESDVEVLYTYVSNIYTSVFIPNSYFYLSPHQKTRKYIDSACKEAGYDAVSNFPTWDTYKWLNKGKFGGVCYNPMSKTTVSETVLHTDRDSAYPYELLFNLYPINQFKFIDDAAVNYKQYNKGKYATLGLYTITYNSTAKHYLTRAYRDVRGEKLEPGDAITINIVLNNVDVNLLYKLLDIKSITCNWLKVANLGPLPDYLCDAIIELYKKKRIAKRNHIPHYLYLIVKKELNAVSGSLQLKRTNKEDYTTLRKSLNPAWGNFMLAYARKNLIDLVLDTTGAVYGDTDSLFCIDTDYNRNTIIEFNEELANHVRLVCNARGWDYNILKGIGEFEIEHECVEFRANSSKQYGYKYYSKYAEDELAYIFPHKVVKAAGYEAGTFNYEDLFLDELDRPHRLIRRVHVTADTVEDGLISEDEYNLRMLLEDPDLPF